MTAPDWVSLDELFTRLLHTEDDALRAAKAAAEAAGMPAIEVSAQHAKLLSLWVRVASARRVLEIGTLAGYSTIALARAVGDGGEVVTLEFEPAHAEVARRNLERAGVADRVEVIVGAALDTLPALQPSGTDVRSGVHRRRQGEQRRLRRVGDRAGRSGHRRHRGQHRPLRPGARPRSRVICRPQAVREMLEMMGAHPRLDTAAIQTVGTKGWDGFAVSVVR